MSEKRGSNSRPSAWEALSISRGHNVSVVEVGGIELAQEITRLSRACIYALVSKRGIRHSKRGNKLYFNRVELLDWVATGNRAQHSKGIPK